MRPLSCSDLQKVPGVGDYLTFKDSDCFVKTKPDANTFKSWAEGLGPATVRLKPPK